MSIVKDLGSKFGMRQTSYMMVVILGMLNNCDKNGSAKLTDVLTFFRDFYLTRIRLGYRAERENAVLDKVATLSNTQIKNTILSQPVAALSSFINYSLERSALSFNELVWKQISHEDKENVRDLAFKHLFKYYRDFSPIKLTMAELQEMSLGFALTSNEIADFSGQNQMKGIHPLLNKEPKAVIIKCNIGGQTYPNEWLDPDKNTLKYYAEGHTDARGKKKYNLEINTNKAVRNSKTEGYPIYVFTRNLDKDLFYFSGIFSFDKLEQDTEGDYYFVLKREEDLPVRSSSVPAAPVTQLSGKEVVNHIHSYIKSQGFTFDYNTISNFYLSLKTKPFVILAGISGTGKSKLVQLFAEAVGATSDNGRYTIIPVKPDWNDTSDLLGYKDINGTFQPGPFCKVIKEANQQLDKPFFVCLDEMNLSRVEHYFSDILSLMETKKKQGEGFFSENLFPNGYFTEYIEGANYEGLRLPPNLYLVGTVNMDETTFPFSKKVLDRANTIEFSTVDLTALPEIEMNEVTPKLLGNKSFAAKYLTMKDCITDQQYIRTVVEQLNEVNRILSKGNLHIGYRVRDELCFYMCYNKEFDLLSEEEAFDNQLLQKILPRIQGSSNAIFSILVELFNLCTGQTLGQVNGQTYLPGDSAIRDSVQNYVAGNNSVKPYPRSAIKIATMLWRFDDGFTSFWL